MKVDNLPQYCSLMEEIKRRTAVIKSIQAQIRKILELIALGSLVSNIEEFSKQKEKFATYWHAEIIDLEDGYLTRDEFIKVYEKCGKIMHADNPYGSKVDYGYYENSILTWINKITMLLNSHLIKLIDGDNFYLIHMKEARGDNVYGYLFGKQN